ncbi:unnamed protein product [Lota lota]
MTSQIGVLQRHRDHREKGWTRDTWHLQRNLLTLLGSRCWKVLLDSEAAAERSACERVHYLLNHVIRHRYRPLSAATEVVAIEPT